MKKLIKILSFVLILTLVFSTVCFAGETNDQNIKLELINELHGKDISEAEFLQNLVFDEDSCEASGTYDDPVSGRGYTLMGSVAVTYPPGTNPPIYSWSGSRTYTY